MESTAGSLFVGMDVLGRSFSEPETMAFVVAGRFDEDIKRVLWFNINGKAPAADTDLDTPDVLAGLERLKNMHRATIRDIFSMAAAEDKLHMETLRPDILPALACLGTRAPRRGRTGVPARLARGAGKASPPFRPAERDFRTNPSAGAGGRRPRA